MAGYSGTPLVSKLGVRAGVHLVAVGDVPAGFALLLEPLPDGASVRVVAGPSTGVLGGQCEIAVLFASRRIELAQWWPALTDSVGPGGAVWVAWPKKASKVATDITEDVVRAELLPTGWVDVKVCAIDATWSGLKLVLRKELRPRP